MKPVLFIGSTVCDVTLPVDHLPQSEEDLNLSRQILSLGGCAFNSVHVLCGLGITTTFLSPVGTGPFGDFVRQKRLEEGIETIGTSSQPNGCTYCLIDASGERTFLSVHGAEYTFEKKWLEGLDLASFSYACFCGLEIEEPTGEALLDALQAFPNTVVFAPGPRILSITEKKIEKALNLHPVLHLNAQEAQSFTRTKTVEEAALALYSTTHNLVIITRGKEGALAYDGQVWHTEPATSCQMVNTNGAGDSHLGAFLAAQVYGLSLDKSLAFASLVSGQVVEKEATHLATSDYTQLLEKLHHFGM